MAIMHLPLKLKLGLHGNFVAEREIDEWSQRRSTTGDLGPVRIAERPLLWQERHGNGDTNGSTGTPALTGTHENGVV